MSDVKTEIDAGHQTLEDMQAVGFHDLTWEQVEKMDRVSLLDIASLCEVDLVDAENCVACRASVLALETDQIVNDEVQDSYVLVHPKTEPAPPSELLDRIDSVRNDVILLLGAVQGEQRVGELTLSQPEMALLVVAAGRYADQQAVLAGSGFVLTPEEIQNVSEVRSLVERIRQEA